MHRMEYKIQIPHESSLEQCRDSLDNLSLKLTNRQCRIFLCKQRGVNCRRLQKLFKSRLIVRRPPFIHTQHTREMCQDG